MTSCALTPTVGAQDEPLPLHDRSETRRKGVDHFHRGRYLKTHLKKQVRSIIDARCVVS